MQTKGPKGEVVADDLADGLEDDTPTTRKGSGSHADEPLNEGLLKVIAGKLTGSGAFRLPKVYPTEAEARKASKVYHRHIAALTDGLYPDLYAVEKRSPKMVIFEADGGWRVKGQTTHRREVKGEDAAEDAAE